MTVSGLCKPITNRFINQKILIGEYVVTGEQVFVAKEPPGRYVNSNLCWTFGEEVGTIVYNFERVTNITHHHILWIGEPDEGELVEELTLRQIQFLQQQIDVDAYLFSCFYDSDYNYNMCSLLKTYHDNYMFIKHMKDVGNV